MSSRSAATNERTCAALLRLALIPALPVLLSPAFASAASWILDAEVGWTHDTNLPRAQLDSDIQSGGAWNVALSAGRFFAPDDRHGFSLTADARAVRNDGHSGLDFEALGGTASWRWKAGLGMLVPWVGVAFSGARENYRTDVRDSDRYSLTLEGGKRFSDRLEGSLGITADRRRARHPDAASPLFPGNTFELSGRSAFVRGSYALLERVDVTFSYGVRSGDVVSSTRRNLQIFRASEAISPDPAFGPDYFAYRIEGVTRTPSLGLQWALAEYSSLRALYSRELTYAVGGLNYYSTVFNIAFMHKF